MGSLTFLTDRLMLKSKEGATTTSTTTDRCEAIAASFLNIPFFAGLVFFNRACRRGGCRCVRVLAKKVSRRIRLNQIASVEVEN